jgi:pimeloyl-ACP methyl ester carboxylesterase
MPISERTVEERTLARKRLRELMDAPVTLARPVYFVPGWRDEMGGCWQRMEEWLSEVVTNYRSHVHIVQFDAPGGGSVPPWEDFLDFGDDLAGLVGRDVGSSSQQVDLVCHSMGGLDAAAAIALLGARHPELEAKPLRCVHTLITFDTPFLGFAAAGNELFKKFVQIDRKDPWVRLQLAAMEQDSKRIAELALARDEFLGNVQDFWPRGADNYDGILEVTRDSAAFDDPSEFKAALRDRYHEYYSWPDTSHSGLANGVTNDVRAILETVEILAGLTP